MSREEIINRNKYTREVAFMLSAQYGIDTPEARSSQAEFTLQVREALREEGAWTKVQ
jgi:hypothetical protein